MTAIINPIGVFNNDKLIYLISVCYSAEQALVATQQHLHDLQDVLLLELDLPAKDVANAINNLLALTHDWWQRGQRVATIENRHSVLVFVDIEAPHLELLGDGDWSDLVADILLFSVV